MRTLSVIALAIAFVFPSVSSALVNPKYQIKTSTAKRHLRKALKAETGHKSWRINTAKNARSMRLYRGPGAEKYFTAKPKLSKKSQSGIIPTDFEAAVHMGKKHRGNRVRLAPALRPPVPGPLVPHPQPVNPFGPFGPI